MRTHFLSHPVRPALSRLGLLAAAGLALAAATANSATRTYTTDADFALGVLENLNFAPPNSNQLQVNAVGVGSKYLFIANHDEATVSKFDTVLNREVARYRTYTTTAGNPSRIAIDRDGNAYILNREPGTGLPPQLMKVFVDSAIDRNGNGIVDTSTDLNSDGIIQPGEILPFTQNDSGANNAVFADERIAWVRRLPTGSSFGRSLCIAPDGKLWAGTWNQSRYYRIDSSNGGVLPAPGANPNFVQLSGWSPYGCTIDRNGILWSATLSATLGRVDTQTGAFTAFNSPFGSTYGIAQGTDAANNIKIYRANTSGRTFDVFDPATNTFTAPAAVNYTGYGIAVDGEGNVIVSNTNGGVGKFSRTGALLWQRGGQAGASQPFGVMVDGNGDIWVMHLNSNNVAKYRGTDGAPQGLFPVGAYPYVYTDGSGLTTRTLVVAQGTWTVVFDSGAAATPWGKVDWNDLVPAGSSVEVSTRSAESIAALDFQPYVPVAKNVNFPGSGRYVQVRARLTKNDQQVSPVLYDLTVSSRAAACDVDGNGQIDSVDVGLVRAGIGQTPTANDPRDANADGQITMVDVRQCTLQCTRPNCAP
jgi:streptogramin lyase